MEVNFIKRSNKSQIKTHICSTARLGRLVGREQNQHNEKVKCQIRRFDLFSQEGLLAEYLSCLKVGASLQEPQLMTHDCLSCGLSHPQHTERKQEKELQLPVPEQREGWRRWRKRKGAFIWVRIEGCVRTGVSDRHSVSGTERSSLWMCTNWLAVSRGDHESHVLRHALSDWLLAHR